MKLFRNAFYWFIGLAIVLVLGFWNSYFSKLGEVGHFTHHLHALAMLGWVLVLITQSWLIRTGRNPQHRQVGKLSLLLAPLVVISGVMVALYALANTKDPMSPGFLGVFWISLFQAALFALFYGLAIRHRRNMKLHARYMVSTALIFLMPGLVRVLFNYVAPLGVWLPNFYVMFYLPLLIALWLLFLDWRKQQPLRPFMLFSALWAAALGLWLVLPGTELWRGFASWCLRHFY
ncbi:MAG: hypothetical protein HKN58_04530 [Xanthomonadales bacterium]|nr:hypothetical protein [Xanthomonadales bacterium]